MYSTRRSEKIIQLWGTPETSEAGRGKGALEKDRGNRCPRRPRRANYKARALRLKEKRETGIQNKSLGR